MVTRRPFVLLIAGIILVLFTITTWQIIHTPLRTFLENEVTPSYTYVAKSAAKTQILYTADSLPKNDFTRLMNLNDFTFLITNTVCDDRPLDLLVLIHSASGNIKRRNAIRETWGSWERGKEIQVLFCLAGVDDQKVQDGFDAEDRKYHDLIQGNFKDAYKNLTYKHVMSFKYTVYFCPLAKYVLKTDDDIFVNMPMFLDFINTFPVEGYKNFVLCSIMDGSPVIREPSKWQVHYKEYPHSFYPIYCSGFGVLYSYDVVFRLYREAQRGDYFWVDDAYVSGILAKRINLKHTDLPANSLLSFKDMELMVKTNGTQGPKSFFYGPVNIGPDDIRKLWLVVNNRIEADKKNLQSK